MRRRHRRDPPNGYMAYAGLRKGECLALRCEDVAADLSSIRVRRSWDWETPKGGCCRTVPVAPALRPFLQDALTSSRSIMGAANRDRARPTKGSDPLFPSPSGRTFSQDVRPQDELRRACLAAGIDMPRIRIHDLRHSCASMLANAGVPMHVVQRILGHSTIVLTNDLYAHISESSLRDAVLKLR